MAVANGLAAIGAGGHPVIRALTGDRDPLVRGAALAAYAALGATEPDRAELAAALGDSAWQVRVGAAKGLAGAPADAAVPLLVEALRDPHLDVRKAAVLSLARWPEHPGAHDGLTGATTDSDADVRAYARRAVTA